MKGTRMDGPALPSKSLTSCLMKKISGKIVSDAVGHDVRVGSTNGGGWETVHFLLHRVTASVRNSLGKFRCVSNTSRSHQRSHSTSI